MKHLQLSRPWKKLAFACCLTVLALAVLAFIQPAAPAFASSAAVTFTTDWAWQGVYAAYLLADVEGYYAQEGISIRIDRGYGSADAISKIAAGVYDFGIADLATLVEFNAAHPDEALTAVAIIYDYSPLCVLTLRETGIATPTDLEGRSIGAPAGSASRRMFPAFAKLVGIDPESVSWQTLAPELRETMLVQKRVDATAPFLDAIITLEGMGIPPDDIVAFHYPAYGLEMYGLALLTRPSIIANYPELVRGVVQGTIRGWLHAIEDPDRTIEVLLERDPLVDGAVERRRLDLAIAELIYTPNVEIHGFGAADPERLSMHISTVVETLDLERTPSVEEIFTDAFLPALEERRLP